jgi:peroxiredoxin
MNRIDLINQVNYHFNQGQWQQALTSLEQLIELDGETENLLDYQFDLLMKLEHYAEAVISASKLEALSARKSPWNCLKIAEAQLGLGQIPAALAWLEKAIVERGFKRCDVFEQAAYAPLKNDSRLARLLEKARENIGLEKPVQDFSIRLLNGETLTLSVLRGQVVLLDFWTSDCPPCVREIPALKQLYADFQAQGFEIIGVSLDARIADAQKYVLTHDLPWKITCSGQAFSDELAERFKIEATPSTWLIDQQGILRFYQLKGQEMAAALQGLLAEKSPSLPRCRGDYCTF